MEAALPHTDIFMPNQGEAEQLAGVAPGSRRVEDLADFFLARGVATMVITRGRAGAYLATGDGAGRPASHAVTLPPPGLSMHAPAYDTRRILNTTGAGDTFGAGFLAGLSRGVDPGLALRVGTLAAALHIEGSDVPPFDDMLGLVEQRPTAIAL